MVDYSKWNEVGSESDDSDDDGPGGKTTRNYSPAAALPAALAKQLADLKAADPEKLDQMEREIEEMKNAALRGAIGGAGPGGIPGGSPVGGRVSEGQADKMHTQLKESEQVMKQRMAELDA